MTPTISNKVQPNSSLRELAAQTSVSNAPSSSLDKDAFLKLLVAQLRFQDPLNPSDPAEFMATTAQFTTIEKLDELTKQGASNAIVTGLSMASSLVGRTVDYLDPDDVRQSGVVSSAQVIDGQVKLVTDNGTIEMDAVVGIGRTSS
ncbi:MAG: flagellar basal-body rod modification protein FlgD [Acidimicrobiales bacterium]|jgi:flagellar basal-body rod modification protein FlgD